MGAIAPTAPTLTPPLDGAVKQSSSDAFLLTPPWGGLRGPNRGNQRHTLDTLDTCNAINVANSKTIPDLSI